jgi:hypothetical protein
LEIAKFGQQFAKEIPDRLPAGREISNGCSASLRGAHALQCITMHYNAYSNEYKCVVADTSLPPENLTLHICGSISTENKERSEKRIKENEKAVK